MSIHTIQLLDINMDNETFLKDIKLEVRSITIMAGINASGKSLINKFVWLSSLGAVSYATLISMQPTNIDEIFKAELNNYFKYTFTDHEEITGGIEVITDIYSIRYHIQDGIVDSFSINVFKPDEFNPETLGTPQYNSKECRTFDQYDRYKKIKRKIVSGEVPNSLEIDEIMEYYKLYEMMWFEKITAYFDAHASGNTQYLNERVEGASRVLDAKDIDGWGKIIIREGNPFIEKNNGVVRLSKLSSGEQSVLMLTLFT